MKQVVLSMSSGQSKSHHQNPGSKTKPQSASLHLPHTHHGDFEVQDDLDVVKPGPLSLVNFKWFAYQRGNRKNVDIFQNLIYKYVYIFPYAFWFGKHFYKNFIDLFSSQSTKINHQIPCLLFAFYLKKIILFWSYSL